MNKNEKANSASEEQGRRPRTRRLCLACRERPPGHTSTGRLKGTTEFGLCFPCHQALLRLMNKPEEYRRRWTAIYAMATRCELKSYGKRYKRVAWKTGGTAADSRSAGCGSPKEEASLIDGGPRD